MAFEKETRKSRGPAKTGGRGGAGKGAGGGKKSFGDKKPSRGFGEKKSFGDKPRSGPKKDFGDRPRRSFDDKPKRDFSNSSRDSARGDRPRRPREEGSEDRPRRSYDDKPRAPRGDFGDRPRRSFDDKPKRDFGDRPRRPRAEGDERPRRSFDDKPKRDFGDRPKRDFGDRPRRPREEGSEDRPRRSYDDKPKRDFGDRPKRDFGDRSRPPRRDSEDRPARRDYSRASDAPRAPRKEFSDRAPRKDFGDRPPRKKYDDDFAPKKREGFEKRDDRKPRAEKAEPIKGHELMFYGVHAVHAALRNKDRKVVQIWVTESSEERLKEAWDKQRHPHPEVIERREMDNRLTAGAVHQGMAIAVEPLQDVYLTDIMNAAHASNAGRQVVVILDEVTDPHNVGAVLRSMSAFGAKAMIVHKRNAPGVTGVMAKIATGAVETIPMVAVTNISQAMTELKNAGFFMLGLDENADYPIQKAPTTGNVALVLGAEGEGLRALTRSTCDAIASIETFGDIKSLNVSNAAAIALFALTQK